VSEIVADPHRDSYGLALDWLDDDMGRGVCLDAPNQRIAGLTQMSQG
jgi:hypothetical protein